jgi:DegV family protein with EDD domain
MIRIVTDSTADLPAEEYATHRVAVVPINIQFGTESFEERVDLTPEAFYRRIANTGVFPKTSQPSPGRFQAVYQDLASQPDTDAILSLHITGHLSGTYDSAVLASRQCPPAPPIAAFDTLSGSMGLGFMVREAVKMAEALSPMSAILARLQLMRERMHIMFALDDLRFARLSGRVGTAQATFASLLQIKPLLTVEAGRLVQHGRARSRAQALELLVQSAAELAGDLPTEVAVVHAQAPDVARQVLESVKARVNTLSASVAELSIGIAVHFGPGTVGVVAYHP